MESFELKNNSNILELVCRICLKINKVRFNLFKHSQNDRLVSDMLTECLPVKVSRILKIIN